MDTDENHRSANPTEVCFMVYLFDDILRLRVAAEIMETDEGAEVESLKFYLFDFGLEEYVNVTAECKEKFSPGFLSEIEDKALAEWEAQK